ncbi:hypothetical protein WMF20_24880 [Sorangium sp. So ce834]|uniref:hypothetical protein n=1 Tax=Sorangium sp. So ce834 TaxID=3133321 RepID=UPI003F5F8C27
MKRRRLVWMAGLAALSPLAAMSPGCSQPKPECTVGTALVSPFAAKFTLIEGDEESPCGRKAGTVERVGMQAYNPDENGDQIPDSDRKLVAIQTEEFGGWARGGATVDPNPDLNPFAVGFFTSIEPDDNEICTVSSLAPAEVVVLPSGEGGEGGAGDGGAGGEGGAGGAGDGGAGGAGDGGAGGEGGAGDGGAGGGGEPTLEPGPRKLEWSNVRLYVTAANLGNQFEAEVTYSEESCSARYKVVGVWPIVDCQVYGENPDPEGEPLPTGKGDESICQDPLSGISPDLKVKCDPVAFVCVLDAESIPAFKK